jgi:hypothetical protein
MKDDGSMSPIRDDEKALLDELNKVSDSPVRSEVWEKVNELEKSGEDDDDEESSTGDEDEVKIVAGDVETTTTETKTKKRKREEDDEDQDYVDEDIDEESDEEDDINSDEDDKVELEEQKLDELASTGAIVNEEEAEIEDAIPLDKLGEGDAEESLLDS